jgi:hypothetical protein
MLEDKLIKRYSIFILLSRNEEPAKLGRSTNLVSYLGSLLVGGSGDKRHRPLLCPGESRRRYDTTKMAASSQTISLEWRSCYNIQLEAVCSATMEAVAIGGFPCNISVAWFGPLN